MFNSKYSDYFHLLCITPFNFVQVIQPWFFFIRYIRQYYRPFFYYSFLQFLFKLKWFSDATFYRGVRTYNSDGVNICEISGMIKRFKGPIQSFFLQTFQWVFILLLSFFQSLLLNIFYQFWLSNLFYTLYSRWKLDFRQMQLPFIPRLKFNRCVHNYTLCHYFLHFFDRSIFHSFSLPKISKLFTWHLRPFFYLL